MVCRKCGAEMDEAQKFCDECGELAEVTEVEEEIEEEVETIEENEALSEAEIEIGVNNEVETSVLEEKPFSLKWYKFISYFALYAMAIVNVLLGLGAKSNGDYYSELFSYYVSEKMGIFFGVAGNFLFLLGVFTAVLAIATGILLVMKKGIGIKLNYFYVGATAVILSFRNVISGIVLLYTGAADIESLIVSVANYLVIGGMLIALNKVYFEKRMEMFRF